MAGTPPPGWSRRDDDSAAAVGVPGRHRRLPVAGGRVQPAAPAGQTVAVPRRSVRLSALVMGLLSLVGAAVVAPGTARATAVPRMPTLRSPIVTPGPAAVSGRITAPGGPYLYDREGRVVFFHGVDAVYKIPRPTSCTPPRESRGTSMPPTRR